MSDSTDTIVAVSSPRGAALRGVVRLSGPDAISLASASFRPWGGAPKPEDVRWGTTRGHFTVGRAGVATPVTLWILRAPRSYTGEDQVELHLPGSLALLDIVVDLLRRSGARPAGAGEFTRRAFLNGRLDLAQAEAVAAVIRARDDGERRAALRVLDGEVSRVVADVEQRVLECLTPVELAIDFSDQDIDVVEDGEVAAKLEDIAASLDAIVARKGARTVGEERYRVLLAGPANAGKSSLFNALLDEDRALVSDVRGTTRDFLEGTFEHDGMLLTFVDTAGDDWSDGPVDAAAHAAREREAGRADLVLAVRDGTATDTLVGETFTVATRADLVDPASRLARDGLVWVSCVTGEGLRTLLVRLAATLADAPADRAPCALALNQRHADAFERTAGALRRAAATASSSAGHELVAADIRDGLAALHEITGVEYDQRLLDVIMRDFCIGK